MEKTWTDQPDGVERAETSFSYHNSDKGVTVEVRALPEPDRDSGYARQFFVTVGNIFGSQTLICSSVESLFRTLELVNSMRKPLKVPPGCVLANQEKMNEALSTIGE